jgi:hypothetical protein
MLRNLDLPQSLHATCGPMLPPIIIIILLIILILSVSAPSPPPRPSDSCSRCFCIRSFPCRCSAAPSSCGLISLPCSSSRSRRCFPWRRSIGRRFWRW